ncbi:AlpA family phage regulatory protein, partial [Salmonella enterica]|nr:AlpA family phage regulatory protein [Salmonella enterica]
MPDIEMMVREGECAWLTGLHQRTRYDMEKRNEFPKRLHLGGKSVGWRLSE